MPHVSIHEVACPRTERTLIEEGSAHPISALELTENEVVGGGGDRVVTGCVGGAMVFLTINSTGSESGIDNISCVCVDASKVSSSISFINVLQCINNASWKN